MSADIPVVPHAVLVVDDEAPVRIVLRRFLERADCVVRDASSAAEALESMRSNAASIIFCDVRMPTHDGFWLVDQIHAQWPGTAIVMVSGADDGETVNAARRKGVVDYLTKPFGREAALQALERAKAFLGG